jgi:heterodisulfide reductase subunit B
MVLARFQGYEAASRQVLQQLGYETLFLKEFCCCGASLLPGETEQWVNLSAYTLALGEQAGADIVTLCGNCTGNLKRVNVEYREKASVRKGIDAALGRVGLGYGGGVRVHHILEVLTRRAADLNALRRHSQGTRVAVTHPCQVYRPKEITDGPGEAIGPDAFRGLLEGLGIETVPYPLEAVCCGATALLFDESLAIEQGRRKLASARAHGADVVCASCGNCLYLLDRHQVGMRRNPQTRRMPVTSLPELVAPLLDGTVAAPFASSGVP